MSLSKDLISQFVKATKDTTTVKKESTVYGTVVKYNEKTYVKIDGSDLLTPAETLSSVEEGERVSIMIKDHTATITGNYTAPSASSIKVDGMDADLKANTADIKNLVAKNAEIENLVASKATIEDLRAANAEIDTLKADYAEIETLVADKASIGDLAAVNADIKSLKADKADIAHLEANYATIGSLNAVYADVTRLEADKANIKDLEANYATIESLEANYATINQLESNYATIKQLDAANANITNLQTETANINTALIDKANVSDLAAANAVINDLKAGKADIGDLSAANAKIADLEAGKADISVLEANYATIKQLDATNANVTNLQTETANINKALIDKADVSDLNATNANITNLQATKANVSDLNATNANVNTLTGNLADITTLVNGNLTSDNIQSMVITGDKFTVEDGFIKNAMIDTVNASKINTGILNTNNVSIQSNDGSMVLQGNLQQFKDKNGKVRIQIGKDATGNFTFVLYDENGTGQLINQNGIQSSNAIADGLIVDSKVADNANIAGSKLDIDSVVTEVNNGTTSIKGTKIYLDDQKQSLNVAFNNMSTTVKGNTNTIQSHTTSINTMNGKVTQLISDTTITKQDGTTTSLKDAYNATVDTVDSHSTKIGSLETNLATANNNISSVSSKQATLEQNLNGFKQTVSDTYTTKAEFNNLTVGGTNLQRYSKPYLLRGNKIYDKWNYGRGTVSVKHNGQFGENVFWLTYKKAKDIDNKGRSWANLHDSYKKIKVTQGKTYTISLDILRGENCKGCVVSLWNCSPETTIVHLFDKGTEIKDNIVYHLSKQWVSTVTGDIYVCVYNWGEIQPEANGGPSNLLFTNIKFEEGNKETSWSPNPLDIDDNIDDVNNKFVNYSTTSQMNSAINQKANEITSTVSETYATKSALNTVDGKFADYSTTSAMNSAINQKANEITSTVSETYATKTSVTDVSNNLKNNYSTTSAMNSAINQKANEITSSVSQTYATKTSVTDVSNNLKNNYSTTSAMNSAIQQKANEITSSVSETYATKSALNTVDNKFANYSTTSAMNSAIQQKANEITSSVSQTYATKTSVTDVSNNLKNNYSTTSAMNSAINQKANEITSSVSDTYATKSALNTVDGKFANYSTTSAMNSAIQQKANEITSSVSQTYATKTSVTDVSNNLKNNYSTTSAMNSAINQKANEITSAVSETYTTKTDFNNLSIGGTNLLLNSDWHKGKQSPWYINAMATIDTTNGRITLPFKSGGEVEVYQTVNIDKPNTKHTFSVYIYENNLEKGLRLYWRNYNSSTNEWSSWSYVVIPLNFTGWYAYTFTPTGSRVTVDVEAYYDTGGKAVLGCFKLEQGNKATAWSPNPADIDSAISTVDGKFINYSTTNQMNSAINQKANEITSTVSETYATKSALTTVDNKFANYSTTSAMNSAINQKANEITSAVSQTYATKTSVTDVSNNLKNNYSTTSAMNSAINQKANEITSSVSETYATKTSVTDVSNNLKNNYSTTSAMNSAINQKANEITSAVSQTYATKSALNTVDGKFANYSTTSAMNSAIQQKANEITSAVSETYTTKADFNNLNIGGTNLQRYSKTYLLRGKHITDIWNYSRGIMKVEYEAPFGENVYWLTYDSAKDSIDAGNSWTNLHDSYKKIKVTKDKVYTISLDILRGGNCKGFRVALWDCTSSDKFIVNLFYKGTDLKDNVVIHLSKQWTSTITGYIYICIYNLGEIASSSVSGTSNLLFTNIKFEEGNKETTWNPNPLDINDNITTVDNKFVNYSTTSQMNSAINQKANEITSTVSETYATKTALNTVDGKFANYSTTSAMNSAINQKANEITSAVSETYTTKTDFNNLSIGGTNLQRYSKAYLLKGASPSNYWNISSNSTLTTISYNDMYNKELVYKLTLPHTATTYAWAELNSTCRKMYIENGKKYTLSLDYTIGYNCKGILIDLYKGSDNSFLVALYQENKSAVGGDVKRKEIVWTSTYTGDVHICIYNLGAIAKDNGDSNLLFTNLKFEQGNKATAWSPSPADVDASITAVDSKFANYSTTTQMNSAIDQKANEITSSVSSTYATKTALNTVDGKFADYSTTSQMNSAIAQKGDAILSTVSKTYTTKTDFNGLSVGGTNLQRFSSSYLLKDKSITNYWTSGRGNLTHASDGSMGGDCYWLAVTAGKIDCYTQLFSTYGHFDIKQGEKYSYSIDYSIGTNCAGIRVQLFNNGDTKNYLLFEDTKNVAGQTNKIHKEGTWTATWTGKAYVCIYNLGFINTANGASNLLFNNIKIEKGTFPTSWSPAPQDVNANIDFISENLSANYSTTQQMNTAINQKAESITQSVSSTYATKTSLKSANDNITSLTNRMQSAESKLTKDSLTTTIGKYYTTSTDVNGIITNKGYATTSQVNQTATDLTAKFSSAGGYNMVRNGGFVKDTSSWTDLGGGIARNSSINTRTGWYVDTVLPKGFCGEWFRIFNGKYYTFSARIWVAGKDLKMTYCTPLDWITNGTGSGGHQGGYIGEYTFSHTTIPKGQWVDIWLTFKCTANGYFKPYIKSESASDTMTISIADIMITEGKVVLPWSPHPYEVYDGITQINKDGIKVYHNNINGENYTHMSPTGFYIKNKGTDIFKVDSNGLYFKGNGEFTGTVSASTINGSTINGSNINSDSFVGDMLAIDGIISAKSLQVQDIDNAKYPGAVTADFKLYVSTSGNDDSEIENGATFATFDGLLDKLPKNLNGHEVRIEMSTNITENVDFKGFFGGKIRLYMKGHTLYGYVVSRMGSARINICSGYIGNASDTSNGWGKIHPSKGYAVSAYTTTVASVDQGAIGLYNIDVYGADNYLSGSTTKLGVAGQDWGTAYLNGVSYYGCDIGARANAGGRIHDVLSYNVCTKYGFYATTGGYITLAGDAHSGGKSKNYHEADAGKVIVASGATFASGEASVPGGSAPVVPTTKTITIKSTYGDTYRSSVYNSWKKDGTVRQGDYGYGDCNGCWFFGDAFSDVEGKTISKVTIKITRQSGGSSSAVGLVVKSHGYSGRPSGKPSYRTTAGTLSLATGASGTLTITNSTILNEIKSGAVKGFGIQTTYDSAHYAVCSGSVTVKITYTE